MVPTSRLGHQDMIKTAVVMTTVTTPCHRNEARLLMAVFLASIRSRADDTGRMMKTTARETSMEMCADSCSQAGARVRERSKVQEYET